MDLGLDKFDVSTDIQLRFRDTDMLGHVNNVVYVTWMELGRMAYTDKYLPNIDWNVEGFILANVNIDFIDPVLLNDKVKVYMRVSRIGSKSITFESLITRDFGEGERPAAKGTNVVVAYDYKNNVSVPVPEAWKETLPRNPKS
jgi:acyl-CoA thioester hydrolase